MKPAIILFSLLLIAKSAVADPIDLEFSWTGQGYAISGNNLTAQVTVAKNDWSLKPDTSFKIKIYAQDTPSWTSSCSVSSFSAFDDLIAEKSVSPFLGSTETVNFGAADLTSALFPFSPGVPRSYCLYAVLDTDNDVTETNEGNNLYTFPTPFTFPGAGPLDLEFNWIGHSYAISGNNLTTQITVAKDDWSLKPDTSFKIKIYAQDTSVWTSTCSVLSPTAFDDLIAEKSVSPFLGSTETVNSGPVDLTSLLFPYSPGFPRKYCLYAILDTDNDVTETNEGNNLYTFPTPFTFPLDSTGISATTPLIQVGLSPNPAANFLNVKLGRNPGSGGRIRIFDSAGHIVLEQMISANEVRLDVSNLVPGAYVLGISSTGTGWTTASFIRE